MSAVKITQKIKGFKVVNEAEEQALAAAAEAASVVQMDETLERPDTLIGATYKIKSPLFEHALYVTINDMVLNAGTAHEQRRPFEIFINSKNMDHFQWIVALTRIMSAVFRKGGDCTFLVEELKAVFDPRGGYLKKGGIYMPSIVAEIGGVLERHLTAIGLLRGPELDEEQRLSSRKTRRLRGRPGHQQGRAGRRLPAGAQLCGKCNSMAVVQMDGCATCLNCGHSKCG